MRRTSGGTVRRRAGRRTAGCGRTGQSPGSAGPVSQWKVSSCSEVPAPCRPVSTRRLVITVTTPAAGSKGRTWASSAALSSTTAIRCSAATDRYGAARSPRSGGSRLWAGATARIRRSRTMPGSSGRGSEAAQVDEEVPVGEAVRQLGDGMQGQAGLADPRLTRDHHDGRRLVRRRVRERGQLLRLPTSTGEAGHPTWHRQHSRGRCRAAPPAHAGGPQQLLIWAVCRRRRKSAPNERLSITRIHSLFGWRNGSGPLRVCRLRALTLSMAISSHPKRGPRPLLLNTRDPDPGRRGPVPGRAQPLPADRGRRPAFPRTGTPGRDPDLSLDIRDVGSLYVGGVTPTLVRAGHILSHYAEAVARADALFRTEGPPHCLHWFGRVSGPAHRSYGGGEPAGSGGRYRSRSGGSATRQHEQPVRCPGSG